MPTYGADLDGDQDMDVFGANYSQVAWWENDGKENFTRHIITDESGAKGLYGVDLDSDNDTDIVGVSYWESEPLYWWENDGTGNFTQRLIDENVKWAFSVFAIDLDDDGDVDVLGASMDSSDVNWWENNGKEFFTKHVVDEYFEAATSIYAVDVDDDNDIDIVAGAWEGGAAWYENDGNENFTRHNLSGNVYVNSIFATDLDTDGDIDVLAALVGDKLVPDDLAWWENDGGESFTKHTIDASAEAVYASDSDGDDDLDVLTAGGAITWWEQVGYELVFLPLALSVDEPPSSAPVLDAIAYSDGDGKYTVSWSTVERASSYTLEENGDASFSSPRVAYSGTEPSETISGKGLGTYYYRVRASGGLGSSDWSNTESVDVNVAPTPVPGPDEGDWSGSNINFTVSGDYVYDLTIDYTVTCPTGIMLKTKTFDEFAPISNDTFEFDADEDPTVEGEFTSNSHARGTWSSSFFIFDIGTCEGSGNWSADGP